MPTPNTGIPYVPEDTTDPAAGLNIALNVIDALLQTAVLDMDLTAPPGSPSDGDLHIVGGSATGEWSGEDGNLARYVAEGSFWQFYEAGTQVRLILNLADGGLYKWAESDGWELVGGLPDAPSDGSTYGRKDSAWEVVAVSDDLTLVTEASPFTADPSTHAGRSRLILAGGDVTFDNAEGYSAGEAYNIRSTSGIDLVEDGVTLTPPAGGTLAMDADMAVTVVMTGASSGIVIGQTVAGS